MRESLWRSFHAAYKSDRDGVTRLVVISTPKAYAGGNPILRPLVHIDKDSTLVINPYKSIDLNQNWKFAVVPDSKWSASSGAKGESELVTLGGVVVRRHLFQATWNSISLVPESRMPIRFSE